MQFEGATRTRILQGVTVVATLLNSYIHYIVWRDGYRELETMGKLFLLNVIGGVVIAVAVLVWRHWLPALAAAGFGAATLAGFWYTKEFGLFDLPSTIFDFRAKLSMVYELVGIAGGLALAYELRPARLRSR